MIPRAPIGLACLLAACIAAAGCRSTDEAPAAKEPMTTEDLNQILSQGNIKPIEEVPPALGAGDPPSEADRAAEKLAQAPPTIAPIAQAEPENPYLLFGKRIQVYPESGLIMKPYPLRAGTGKTLTQLLKDYGNFPLWEPGQEHQHPDQVRMELVERWDQELFSDMRQNVPTEDKVLPVADWLLVVTGIERMKEVESFINIFAASVPQIEIEAKIVEILVTDTIDLGIRPVDATTPIFGFPDGTFVNSFNYNLPNSAGAINSFLTLGGVQDGFAFNAVLQALATFENVSIVSSPKIAVREGVRAQFVNIQSIPSVKLTGISGDGKYTSAVQYDDVGIKLYVIPRVVGTQTVGLNIDIEASSVAGNAVTFAVQGTGVLGESQTVTNPIISKRAAQTVVYLEPGQAVILGGLISERTIDGVNKVPILGDIPVLGYLFKSTSKRKEKTNVLFFIRPRILQGSDLNREF